jgi:hypothetical protein
MLAQHLERASVAGRIAVAGGSAAAGLGLAAAATHPAMARLLLAACAPGVTRIAGESES